MVGQWAGPGKKVVGHFFTGSCLLLLDFFRSAHAFSLLVMMHIRDAQLTDRVNIVYVY